MQRYKKKDFFASFLIFIFVLKGKNFVLFFGIEIWLLESVSRAFPGDFLEIFLHILHVSLFQ